MAHLSILDMVYLTVLVVVLAASVYGTWAEHVDDNAAQRTGMFLAIFGCVGEIQGLVRQVDTFLSPVFLFCGVVLFALATLLRLRS